MPFNIKKTTILCFFLFLNMMSFDIVLGTYIPSGVIKFVILFGILFSISGKDKSARNKKIFNISLLYALSNLFVAYFIFPENLTPELLNSLFSLVVPALVFTFDFQFDKNYERVLKTFIWAPIGVLILGIIYSFVLGRPVFRAEGEVSRLQGGSVPAHYGMICFFAIVCMNILMVSSKRKVRQRMIMMAILFLLLYLTGARTALFCALLFTAFFVLKFSKLSFWTKVILSSGTFALLFLYLILNNSRNEVTNGDDTVINTSGRTDAWLFFYEKYLTNPYWGIGAGNSSKFMKNSDIEFFITPHNEYLRLFLESGAVGAVLVILFVLPEVFKNLKPSNFKKKDIYVFIISTLYLNVLIFSFTDNTFATYQFYIPFLVLINLAGTILQKKRSLNSINL